MVSGHCSHLARLEGEEGPEGEHESLHGVHGAEEVDGVARRAVVEQCVRLHVTFRAHLQPAAMTATAPRQE